MTNQDLEELSIWLKEKNRSNNDEAVMASLAILFELKRNLDKEGNMPSYSRQYIEEKFDIIRRRINNEHKKFNSKT
jgi:hypothetical protein